MTDPRAPLFSEPSPEAPRTQNRITRGIPLNNVSTANLITSPAEDVLFDKVNEIIDRINQMSEIRTVPEEKMFRAFSFPKESPDV